MLSISFLSSEHFNQTSTTFILLFRKQKLGEIYPSTNFNSKSKFPFYLEGLWVTQKYLVTGPVSCWVKRWPVFALKTSKKHCSSTVFQENREDVQVTRFSSWSRWWHSHPVRCETTWMSPPCKAKATAENKKQKQVKGSYCATSSSEFSSGQYLRGRPRWIWRPRLNSSSSTVQKDPHSSSTLIKHLCSERLVRMAPWGRSSSKGDEVATKGDGVGGGTDIQYREQEKENKMQ